MAGEFRSLGGTGFRIEANENFRRNPSGPCRGLTCLAPVLVLMGLLFCMTLRTSLSLCPSVSSSVKSRGQTIWPVRFFLVLRLLYISPDSRTAHLPTSYPLDFPPLSEGPDHLFINSPGQDWFDIQAHKPLSKASHKSKHNICSGLSKRACFTFLPSKQTASSLDLGPTKEQ